ncbi:MAG: DegV family EDD domain-containing protein [Clostridia bacterium]|nr:DegV family EDD domain-containing protein [Clostridia bacterium]
MRIAVSVESTNDLSKQLLLDNDIKVISYQISLGDAIFKDGDKTTEEIFEQVDKLGVLPKTTALNSFEYTEFFEGLLKEYDAVVHVCLSSGLSSSCSQAFAAANNLKNVYVVDSKSLSTGIGLLALYARELATQGVDAKEIAQKVQARVDKLQVSFVVERLDYLYKGGRCSALARFGANIFHIRPRIVVKDGKMGSDKKYRGQMDKVIEKYCNDVLEEFNTPDLSKVFITYTTATPAMVEAAKTACVNAGFKNIYETRAGGTIASHCGANTLGILYFNDGDQN